MQLRATLMALAAVLAALGARAVPAASGAVNACTLLAAAVHDEPYWRIHLTKHTFTAAPAGAWRCELTSAPPAGLVSPTHVLVLTFFASPTAAVAHTNVASLGPRKGRPLRGTGVDEAFAQQGHAGGSTTTRVTWRKGRYWGFLSVHGPKLAGDTEDAADLLKGFARRLPSR